MLNGSATKSNKIFIPNRNFMFIYPSMEIHKLHIIILINTMNRKSNVKINIKRKVETKKSSQNILLA